MARIVLLDAGPLGYVVRPRTKPEVATWLARLVSAGVVVAVPEISDYEVRRELVRINSTTGIARLDALAGTARYVPLTTAALRRAAQLWADMRTLGLPTADPAALDGDVILAAQAELLQAEGHDTIVATTNLKHLDRLTTAELWNKITP